MKNVVLNCSVIFQVSDSLPILYNTYILIYIYMCLFRYRTPLLEQKPQLVNIAAVSVAAAFEAYYRSMMNSLLNASLMNQKGSNLFPNMHLQVTINICIY